MLYICPPPQPTATEHFRSHQSPLACPYDQRELDSHALLPFFLFYSRVENNWNMFSITKYSEIELLEPRIIFNNHNLLKLFFKKAEIDFDSGHHLDWELEEEEKDGIVWIIFYHELLYFFKLK